MKYLVYCPCGHAMDRHRAEGCEGTAQTAACDCRNDELTALDAAIEHARVHPWENAQVTPSPGADAA